MKVQNLLFLKMLVLLFSAILKKFGGLISNVMSPIESKNPHPLSPLGGVLLCKVLKRTYGAIVVNVSFLVSPRYCFPPTRGLLNWFKYFTSRLFCSQ